MGVPIKILNMRKFFLPFCFIAVVSLTSCGGNPPEAEETTIQPASTTQLPLSTDSSATPAGLTPSTATTAPNVTSTTTQQPTQSAAVPVQQKSSKSTAKLNPAHGQPGHRCDIEVGAPLSSAPAQTTQIQQTAPPVTAPTTPAPTSGTVKLNPAHGQPGHDCAIPVGQPLKG
jgi:hypothetical protein